MQYPMIAQPQYGFAPTMPMMANGGSVADAQSVQSKGRGKDTMLVHMTPKEVGGLQALAMQHGGSLTINPQTGLPEAGFLEAILPTLAGAALTIGSGGVINPYMSAAIVGGIQTARTGDLGQGLLAGLGAYGGAGLGAGLTSAGASAAPSTVAPTAGGIEFATAPADAAAATGGEAAAVAGAPPVMPDPSVFPNATVTTPGGDVTYARAYTGPTAAPSAAVPDAPSVVFDGTGGVPAGTNANFPAGTAVNPTTPSAPTIGENFAQAGQGVKNIFTEPGGFDKFVGEAAVKADPSKGIQAAPATGLGGGFGAAKTAAFAAAPALLAQPEYDAPAPKKEEASNYEGPYTPSARRVSYPGDDERRRTSEFTYFTPSNPVPFDEGGKVEEDRSVKMPDASYVAGQAPEFNHNFRAVEVEGGFPSAPISPDVSGISSGLMQLMGSSIKDAAKNQANEQIRTMAGYQYDPRTQRLVKSSSTGGLPVLARGGSVPTLENGGFVLTKKAVDGLGRGNNEKGQANAQRGLGAIPIRGAGAKRGPKAGVDDKIKTTIDGKRPALVSNGEAYVPKKQVAKKGGAKAFYALMKQAEKAADKRRRA
jgi:hypothetical protein